MTQDNLVKFKTPETPENFSDALSALIRSGAQQIIAQAVEAELNELLGEYQAVKDDSGRQAVVRNGYLPARTITTGVGEVEVQVPKVRDRTGSGIKFNSSLLPPYLKRSRSVEEVLPWLYLKGISTGDFAEALSALLGPEAKGLSSATISRLKAKWQEEHSAWQTRSMRHKRYVYVWADGIYFNIRDDERQCILVMIGVTDTGRKELLGMEAGYRESALNWKTLMLRLVDQGLQHDPLLAIGDGALGFWKALPQVWPATKTQRCWVHKTANVLNKLPKKLQPNAKFGLWEIYRAETKTDANQAFNRFIKTYQAKYPEASECLGKDRDVLLAFYDFPAEHWKHIRSSNPIESTSSTVRLRTKQTRGALSKTTVTPLVFKLVQSAQLRIRGFKLLGDVIEGVQFRDGIRQEAEKAIAQPTEQKVA
ncbi:MAG: IS256 family transposase [Leptolyngbya foveolarum]|uniref:Mutator family transposase n=1 Tax=Leptolyngbya foveolarum TaxID=47253 RepID=A0A2W4W0R3_9CYAN|nr:MAG: IS256 family transposase [Leptolyngbya foveolarum]